MFAVVCIMVCRFFRPVSRKLFCRFFPHPGEKWIRLESRFINIIGSEKMRNAFGKELNSLEYHFEEISSVVRMKRVSPLETWKNLEDEYPTLCTLVRALMVLPISTVAVERAFSSLKNIKIPKRNRLIVQNLRLVC